MSQPIPELDPSKSRRRSFIQYAVLAIFCLLVAGPITTYGCRGERAKWAAASAMNVYASGNRETALKQLEAAVVDSNYDPGLSAGLANLLAENGKAQQGLEICNKVLEVHRDPVRTISAMLSKSNCQQHLNRPEQALETLKSVNERLKPSQQTSDQQLNNLAYYRALANVELRRARSEIRDVILNQSQKATWPVGFDLTLSARTFVSIGLIARQLDRQGDALKLLDREITKLTEFESAEDLSLTERIYEAIQESFPLKFSDEEALTRSKRTRLNRRRDCLAFLLLTRALIHQDLDNDRQSELDRVRVQQLGYQTDDMVDKLPTNQQCLTILDQAATYLDTHGYVLLQQRDFGPARENLDLAIAAAEFNLHALDSPLHNSSEELSFDARQLRPAYERIAAVLHYHRYQLYQRLQLTAGQDGGFEVPDDAKRIRELGFDPDSRLF